MTDIEGSTRLWDEHPSEMEHALQRHDEMAAEIIALRDGVLVKRRGEGDSLFAVFDRPSEAAAAALEFQHMLLAEPEDGVTPLRVRTAIHTGEAEHRDGDYFGPSVNRCARLRAIAYGGQILLSRTAFDLAQDNLPPDASVLPLGEVKLRDLDRPEEVFQLLHPRLPADYPRPRSVRANPNNLPAQPSSFVGRGRELATLERMIERDRLVTITGPTGSGKTRLALQAGVDLLDRFREGVWLVELAAVADEARVPQVVAEALGVSIASGESEMDAICEHLRSRTVLLILDNCEHLLLACAQLIDRVLRACAGVRILATSQFTLGIGGEQGLRILSLSMPEGLIRPSVENLSQFEAVRLFVDRATEARSTFEVTNQNAPAVAEICDRLDGIPLAIELAAARINVLTAEQIAERLDDRFRLLTGGSRTAMPRHQTLQAAVDWTYDLLSEDERTLFQRLSVFRGGWTLDAAQEVCICEHVDGYLVLDLMGQLADKSLVHVQETGGVARYYLLETLRYYAWTRMEESGGVDALCGRHAAYYAQWMVSQRGYPDDQPTEYTAVLRPEAENLQAMLEWVRIRPEDIPPESRRSIGWAALVVGARQLEHGEPSAAIWLEQASLELREASLPAAERHARHLLFTARAESAVARS